MSKIFGNLSFQGNGQVFNLRIENLAADPAVADLAGGVARLWFNTTDAVLRYFDGVKVEQIAVGGTLEDYLRRDGTAAMLADLILSSADQSTSGDLAAISKGYFTTVVATKQDVITGAASTIVTANLSANKAVITDANGKVAESAASAAEVAQLVGVTSPIQTQIDSKQANLGYVPVNKAGDSMNGDLAFQDHRIIGLPKGVDPTEPVRVTDLDAALAGFNWQDDVTAIQKDATLVPVLTVGTRYILTDIAALDAGFGTIAGVANGDIVESDGSAFHVVYDVVADPKAEGAIAFSHADQQFVRFVAGVWTTFYGLESLVAGNGLSKEGNVLSVNLGAGIAQLPSDEVGVDAADGLGLFLNGEESTDTAARLEVKIDGTTLSKSSTGLKVPAQGITEAELAASVVGTTLTGGAGHALEVNFADGLKKDEAGKLAVDFTELDTKYLNVSGDTAADLKVTAAPVAATDVARLQEITDLSTAVNNAIGALATRYAASTFVYDGTLTAQASHTVTHGLGNKYAVVVVTDENDSVILPDDIHFVDANTLVVSVLPAAKIKVIVNGVKAA
jgi:hypothetical protein